MFPRAFGAFFFFLYTLSGRGALSLAERERESREIGAARLLFRHPDSLGSPRDLFETTFSHYLGVIRSTLEIRVPIVLAASVGVVLFFILTHSRNPQPHVNKEIAQLK
jgi:hypothetical protein